MNTVKQLLQNKGHEVLSIEPHNSVYNAMQIMATRDIGSLLVLEDEKLIGIITARSFFSHIRLLDKPLRDIQVEEIMTSKVTYIG
ncbi:MAG: CBS domain-containing protein, partial [Gammaproteobacteria bacterium]|nr:CBS domain-containing protein [Gammaproteobacteria bacterium]